MRRLVIAYIALIAFFIFVLFTASRASSEAFTLWWEPATTANLGERFSIQPDFFLMTRCEAPSPTIPCDTAEMISEPLPLSATQYTDYVVPGDSYCYQLIGVQEGNDRVLLFPRYCVTIDEKVKVPLSNK